MTGKEFIQSVSSEQGITPEQWWVNYVSDQFSLDEIPLLSVGDEFLDRGKYLRTVFHEKHGKVGEILSRDLTPEQIKEEKNRNYKEEFLASLG